MSAQVRTEVTVYCDGGWHTPMQFTVPSGLASPTSVRAMVKHRGWTVRGEETFCPQHKPPRKARTRG